ncbi:hypothetical protein [Streptomyces sp. NBC_00154]|uniref:hypothetical protein n=1 Tax=Streptomyces sp. NBC_00154 TaxID=2975670 RepID=UPI002254BBFE|nr:hypothetical protein [Streptomyces sp. NBC_00154]MCX5311441.1 hypothetical protein [Streptomyces sp. NBC_00154]
MSDDKKIQVPTPKAGTTGDANPEDSHMTDEPEIKPLDSHMTGEPEIKPLDSHMTDEPEIKPLDSHMTGADPR